MKKNRVNTLNLDLLDTEHNTTAMNWIKLTDRLPELVQMVLLFDDWKSSDGTKYKDVRVGYLSEFTTRKTSSGIEHTCEWGGTEFAFNITHWMPLPEPPKD